MFTSIAIGLIVFAGLAAVFALLAIRTARHERRRLAPVAASVVEVDARPIEDLTRPQSQLADVAIRGHVVATDQAATNPLTGAQVAHHKTAVYLIPVGKSRPRLVHTIEEGGPFWLRDASGWAVVDATGASYSIRSPRGEIETMPLKRVRFGLADAPASLVERLAREIGHEPDPHWLQGYLVEQAVIVPGAEITLYGRPDLVRVDRLPEASPSYRQGSALVPRFAGPQAKVLFSEMDHATLEAKFQRFETEERRRETRAMILLAAAVAVSVTCSVALVLS